MKNFDVKIVLKQASHDPRWCGVDSHWAGVCIVPVLKSLDPSIGWKAALDWVVANRDALRVAAGE